MPITQNSGLGLAKKSVRGKRKSGASKAHPVFRIEAGEVFEVFVHEAARMTAR